MKKDKNIFVLFWSVGGTLFWCFCSIGFKSGLCIYNCGLFNGPKGRLWWFPFCFQLVSLPFSVWVECALIQFLTILSSCSFSARFLLVLETKTSSSGISTFFLMQSCDFFLIRPLCGQSQLFFLRIKGPIKWKWTRIFLSFFDPLGVLCFDVFAVLVSKVDFWF